MKELELQVQEKTIKELKDNINYNKITLSEFKEYIEEFTNKLDKLEIERDKLKTERDTLAIKNKKTTLLINYLKKDRLEIAEFQIYTVKGLESEI
ncbi:unnamed protein product [Clonostachys rhizophaga]|uniref:Uncharacterized protein n=1 Tax=Clonostachys rhizophaga TaxID=160324 RepID=A0A9N9VF42_9HYPO|nr:unnamed protein product [Clonostachys rhizophaga]